MPNRLRTVMVIGSHLIPCIPKYALPSPAMNALSCHEMPFPAMKCLLLPWHTLSYHALLRPATPYYFLPCHPLPSNDLPPMPCYAVRTVLSSPPYLLCFAMPRHALLCTSMTAFCVEARQQLKKISKARAFFRRPLCFSRSSSGQIRSFSRVL